MRFAACFFAQPLFMLISFIFGYLESFFVVFYISFYLHLATGRSARNMLSDGNDAADGDGYANRHDETFLLVGGHTLI